MAAWTGDRMAKNRRPNFQHVEGKAKQAPAQGTPRRGPVFLLGLAGSSWMIYNMATTTAGPSQFLVLMKFFILAVLVVVTLYSGANWLVMK
jgi:hypothetical protein